MGRAIRIIAADAAVTAELNDTQTAMAIWAALPIEARGQTWGDEIYFGIGIRAEAEAANCIFFGPTPMSHGDEIRPASPVTVVGRVLGDATVFKKVPAGTMVRLERQDRGA